MHLVRISPYHTGQGKRRAKFRVEGNRSKTDKGEKMSTQTTYKGSRQ